MDLIRIKFTYLDAMKNKIPYQFKSTLSIKSDILKQKCGLKVHDAVTDAFSDNSRYSITYWEFTINPRNI